jgi:hypothetical protein
MRDLIKKRAQIGTTLTWLIAFTIIFFMLIIFVGGSALLSLKKGVPSVSESNPNSKSINLSWRSVEPSGVDFGDLALERDLVSFLNMPSGAGGQSFGDLIQGFDPGVYSNPRLMSDSDIQAHEEMKLLYESAVANFDELYGECYVICLEFRTASGGGFESITSNQIIIGKECNPKTEKAYGRLRGYYGCYVTSSNAKGVFNYAKIELHPDRDSERVVHVKMLKGVLQQAGYPTNA